MKPNDITLKEQQELKLRNYLYHRLSPLFFENREMMIMDQNQVRQGLYNLIDDIITTVQRL